MTQKEYFLRVAELNSYITFETAQNIKQQLDELFAIKPTRLPWIVAKAKAMVYAGDEYNDIFNLLGGKAEYLYNYAGIEDVAQIYSWMNRGYEDRLDAKRNKIHPWLCIEQLQEEHKEELQEIFNKLLQRQNDFLDDVYADEKLLKLQESYFITADYVSYSIVSHLLKKRNVNFVVRDFIETMPNFGYLKECVISENYETFIIVATEENITDCEVAATILSLFEKQVFLLVQPLTCPVDYEVDIIQTVAISMDNRQECDGVQVITPLDIMLEGRSIGDNRAEIIDYLARKCSEKGLATILASGELMDSLCETPVLQKQMERLSQFMADGLERNLSFGWVGNYLTYISQIYGYDAEEAINRPAECDFSIVIPARNSSSSLRYTLQTCLELDYAGTYEIVVSDNSTNGNEEVYELIRELNDSRIHYYKTPRDLHLPKSFEFAFLKARGEFIFSIGSDDGVLPWCLTVLKEVLEQFPKEEIIKWDRGFYAWPGFNRGQQNQFIIPRNYCKDQWNIKKVESQELLAGVLKQPSNMYALPMLYINSGFRRSYFKTLLDKTGRLWDGICQDIYMGVINIAINNEILVMEYPLTIAGMTNASIGKTSKTATTKMTDAKEVRDTTLKSNNIGGFSMSKTERLMPELRSDVSSLYNCLLRAIARGVMPRVYLEQLFDWKKMYLDCIALMDKADVFFDKNVHYMRYTATKHGEEFLKWFDEKVYPILMAPVVYENNQSEDTKRDYEVGIQENGKRVLDASEYGVKNIYDAVQLFVKLSGLF